jgi:hypothetical protein
MNFCLGVTMQPLVGEIVKRRTGRIAKIRGILVDIAYRRTVPAGSDRPLHWKIDAFCCRSPAPAHEPD